MICLLGTTKHCCAMAKAIFGISNLRVFLHKISENLVSDEVASLKFLCCDILTKARLEKIINARELFVAIGEVVHDEEEQLQYFKFLFETIGRFDLKSKILEFEKSRKAEVRDINVGQHEEIGNDAAPVPVPYQSSAGRHADITFYQPPQPGPSQPSGLSVYKQDPVTVPEDVRVPTPPDMITSQAHYSSRNPFFPDYSGNLPANPTQTNPFLRGFDENPRRPVHSAITNLLQHNAPEELQISQASTGGYTLQQDSAKEAAEKLHPHHNIPFSQEEKSHLEIENLKTEVLQVNLPSIVKPLEDPVTNNVESRNTVVPENKDQPDRGRQNVPPGKQQSDLTMVGRSGENLPFPWPQEKVPVERCISTDFYDAGLYCSQKKCPVEMSYEDIKSYRGAKELGKGGFGVVYEGTKTFHGQHVVVKEAYASHCGQAYSSGQLKREKRVGYIKHPHLMPLYAFSEEKGKPCCLMYPKMASDLYKALRKDSNGKEKLPWENRVRIALHTARALKYLHTEVNSEKFVRKEIVHMDVKPGNIFLDEDLNARLGDAGMAQELPMGYSFASFSQMRGTQGYLDPHNLDATHFRPINDIFSYGIVLLRLLTQRKAVERVSNMNKSLYHVLMEEDVLSDPEKLMRKAKQDVWPASEETQKYTKEFAAIAIECLRPPNKERAKLDDICRRLEEILESRRFAKLSKPREGARCMSCLLNYPAKHLVVKSSKCDGDHNQDCNHFCVTCLKQARRNPLECPFHGPAEPCIGGSDVYAVLVCGNDAHSQVNAAVFERDLYGMKSVLTDPRVVGIRSDHMYCIKPQSSGSQAAEVRNTLGHLKEQLAKEGKRDVFLYFCFSGHSDQNGNLMCSSEQDVFTGTELRESLDLLKDNVGEFLVILDCCYADGKIASEQIEDERFLVHKSPESVAAVEFPHQFPLESLFSKLDCSEECAPTAVQGSETYSDTLDGSVFSKAPHILHVRQWSSSLKAQLSFGKRKGNSFLTEYIILGLQGAHKCPFARPECLHCETFKAKAKSVGYISAANLEDFVSKHVEKAATKSGGRHQNPQMRTLHSKDTVLAYYNEESLCDEVTFKSISSDCESVTVDHNCFPLTPEELQAQVYSKVADKLPNGSQPKHLQTLCDGEELSPTSDVDLIEFIREGYHVQCQMRPCSCIFSGPVMLEFKNCRESITRLLNCLQLKKTHSSLDLNTFELDTNQRKYGLDDIEELWDDNSSLRNLPSTPFGDLIVLITTSSQYMGTLTICALPEILDCSFQATT